MINSSALEVETPVKVFIRRKNEVTPVKCDLNKRFCPSAFLKRKLIQIDRVHYFQFHENICFLPLKDLKISKRILNELSKFFQSSMDIPDLIKKHEEIALDAKYYSPLMRDYIAEEFGCLSEYSFCIISVLHYIKRFNVSSEDALCELFLMSTSLSLCPSCTNGDTELERKKLAEMHNFILLESLKKEFDACVTDLCVSDDSDRDPTCRPEDLPRSSKDGESSLDSESSQDSNSNNLEKKTLNTENEVYFNPFQSVESCKLVDDDFCFNPFIDDLKDKEVYNFDDTEGVLNSTLSFNPFSESDTDLRKEIIDISSIKVHPRGQDIKCDFCVKNFSNRHNMKLHLIG